MFEKKMTDEERKVMAKEARKAKKAKIKIMEREDSQIVSMAKTVVIPLILAAIMVCFLFIVERNNTLAENLKTDVVVAKTDIAKNTKIEKEDIDKYFKVISVDYKAVTDINYKSFDDMPDGSFYVKEPLVKNQMIYEDDIETSDFVMDKYTDEAVITSVSVSNFSNSVCGTLRTGDIVDVYAIDPATDELVFILGDVYIVDAYNSNGEILTTKDGSATAFTILATPDEVELINKAIAWDGIQLYRK